MKANYLHVYYKSLPRKKETPDELMEESSLYERKKTQSGIRSTHTLQGYEPRSYRILADIDRPKS